MAPTDKKLSQLDFGGVLKSAHEDQNQSLRVTSANTSVPPKYSRVVLTYNASDSVTNATFYKGTLAEKRDVRFVADVAGSLNNTYFTLYSENDESLYHVWYNVSGGGTDPAPAGSTGIEIPIATGDAASIVALATILCLKEFCDFEVERCSDTSISITNARKGVATNTADFGTGFTITTVVEGAEKLLKSIDVPYDGKTRYIFNTQEKKFEVIPSADVTVVIDEVDIKNPNTITVKNDTVITANSEFSIALLDDTKRFTVKVRGSASKLRLAFASGATSTAWHTVERGNIWDSSEVDLESTDSIYLQSDKAGVVIETTIWTRV